MSLHMMLVYGSCLAHLISTCNFWLCKKLMLWHQFCQSILSKLSNNVIRRLIKRDYLLHINLKNQKKKTLISRLQNSLVLIWIDQIWSDLPLYVMILIASPLARPWPIQHSTASSVAPYSDCYLAGIYIFTTKEDGFLQSSRSPL